MGLLNFESHVSLYLLHRDSNQQHLLMPLLQLQLQEERRSAKCLRDNRQRDREGDRERGIEGQTEGNRKKETDGDTESCSDALQQKALGWRQRDGDRERQTSMG